MWGHSEVPAVDGDRVRDVMVVSAGRGGGVDTSLVGLHAALVEAFDEPGVAKHLRKVGKAEADERHLCLLIHRSALPFAVADGLWTGTMLPPDAPPLPDRRALADARAWWSGAAVDAGWLARAPALRRAAGLRPPGDR